MDRFQDLKASALPSRPSFQLPSQRPGGFSKRPKRKRSFSQIPWDNYYSKRELVQVGKDSFCVYKVGDGPVVMCLHGGGHSALSWAVFASELVKRCHVQVIAVDQRGHGDTYTTNDTDLSADTLTDDVVRLWGTLHPSDHEKPPLVLLGHSMGGAVVVRISGKALIPNIRGIAVIDVVEGSAMDALSTMQGFLKRRPQRFETIEKSIEWVVKSGQLRNNESARVSMKGQLRPVTEDDKLPDEAVTSLAEDTIQEDSAEDPPAITPPGSYTWRVDLSATEPYWRGWFEGMSELFLNGSAPKLLLLAEPDRLDKLLTVGHMQGKFQLQVFNQSGHSIQEDNPEEVADVLASFLVRQQIAEAAGAYNPAVPCC